MLTIYNQTDLSDQSVIPAAMQLYEGGEYGECTIKVYDLDIGVKYLDMVDSESLVIYHRGEQK